jgi:hypothetical protein
MAGSDKIVSPAVMPVKTKIDFNDLFKFKPLIMFTPLLTQNSPNPGGTARQTISAPPSISILPRLLSQAGMEIPPYVKFRLKRRARLLF